MLWVGLTLMDTPFQQCTRPASALSRRLHGLKPSVLSRSEASTTVQLTFQWLHPGRYSS